MTSKLLLTFRFLGLGQVDLRGPYCFSHDCYGAKPEHLCKYTCFLGPAVPGTLL